MRVLLVSLLALLCLGGCLTAEYQLRVDEAMHRAQIAEQVLSDLYKQFESGEIDTPEELGAAVQVASNSIKELGAVKEELEAVKKESGAAWWKMALGALGSAALGAFGINTGRGIQIGALLRPLVNKT